MRKITVAMICFSILTLIVAASSVADYQITNSTTEDAWVVYAAWRSANGAWPEGWRTQGYYKIAPGETRNLQVPVSERWVYIRVENTNGEMKPPDHATRDRFLFWRHPSKAFTVVENDDGDFLKSNHGRWSLEQAYLYEYRNGGSHTLNARVQPNLDVDQIYDQAMRSVVWIYNVDENSEGSGVLIDQDRKFVVTNQHVVGNADKVFVCFPVPGQDGELIGSRDYYIQNYRALLATDAAAWGRVITKNPNRDLAIVQLDSISPTVREIPHNMDGDLSRNVKKGEAVHILGNPGKLDLWRWTLGLFHGDTGVWLEINADIFGGNSGGPVLNGQGQLIGIITLTNKKRTKTWAVPARHVKDLLDTIGPKHTFRIVNKTDFTLSYQVKWSSDLNWELQSLNSGSSLYYWWNGNVVPWGYPQIRFDNIVGDGRVTAPASTLNTFLRYFGQGFRDHLTPDDAYTYSFSFNPWTRRIILSPDIGAAPALSKSVPKENALFANYPNPSNPETWIPYQLAKPAAVDVRIYSADGRLIRTLTVGHQPAGVYQTRGRAAHWDGRNAVGEPVASGVYFYTLTAGEFTATRKLLIRK